MTYLVDLENDIIRLGPLLGLGLDPDKVFPDLSPSNGGCLVRDRHNSGREMDMRPQAGNIGLIIQKLAPIESPRRQKSRGTNFCLHFFHSTEKSASVWDVLVAHMGAIVPSIPPYPIPLELEDTRALTYSIAVGLVPPNMISGILQPRWLPLRPLPHPT